MGPARRRRRRLPRGRQGAAREADPPAPAGDRLLGAERPRRCRSCSSARSSSPTAAPSGSRRRSSTASSARSSRTHPPPQRRGKRLRLYYSAQVGARPPRIAIQVNDRRLITQDWAYHLENRLREHYALEGVPLVIDFIPKKQARQARVTGIGIERTPRVKERRQKPALRDSATSADAIVGVAGFGASSSGRSRGAGWSPRWSAGRGGARPDRHASRSRRCRAAFPGGDTCAARGRGDRARSRRRARLRAREPRSRHRRVRRRSPSSPRAAAVRRPDRRSRAAALIAGPAARRSTSSADIRPWFGGEVAVAVLAGAAGDPERVELIEVADAEGATSSPTRSPVGGRPRTTRASSQHRRASLDRAGRRLPRDRLRGRRRGGDRRRHRRRRRRVARRRRRPRPRSATSFPSTGSPTPGSRPTGSTS